MIESFISNTSSNQNELFDTMAQEILQSSKYRSYEIPRETVLNLLVQENLKYRDRKSLVKAVRQKLHNIIAPYLEDLDYEQAAAWLDDLEPDDAAALMETCERILSAHASTRERMPILKDFYQAIFQVIGRPVSILDIACGLHPFSIPWMGIPNEVVYYAYDIHGPRVALINKFFKLIGLQPAAEVRDVLVNPPSRAADTALLFKEAHRMEQRKKGCSRDFWQQLNVHYLLVSLPSRSLSGQHDLTDRNRRLIDEISAIFRGHCVNYRYQVSKFLLLISKMAQQRQRKKTSEPGLPPIEQAIARFKSLLPEIEFALLLKELENPLFPAIRTNMLKVAPQEAIKRWEDLYGWQVKPVPFCDTGWWVTHSEQSISQPIEHRLGYYYIQDAASMLPVSLFEINPGERPLILDMAASPGGKTTHLIDRSADLGLVVANDSSRDRITMLRLVLQNWGALNVGVTRFPGEKYGVWFPNTFDLVLLDAPCSMQNLRSTEARPMQTISAKERSTLAARQERLLISVRSRRFVLEDR